MNNKNKSVAQKLGRTVKNNGTARAALIITALALVVFLFAGVAAKYVSEREIDDNKVTPSNFYFTVDLLGDTNTESSLSKTFDLYGGDAKEIKFNVQNYFDSSRITSEAIKYTVEVVDSGSTYDKCSLSDANGTLGEDELILNGGEVNHKPISLNIQEEYANNDTVVVKVKSTAPYEKEMTLTFVLHTYESPAKYRIEDSADSAVASLIIMTEEDISKGNLTVDWSNISDLRVDTTNMYVLDENLKLPTNSGNVTDADGYLTKIKITKELKAGQSILIYFFKTDITKDYSVGDTKVEKNVDGKINIVLNAVIAGGENG
ncbi:MAG: hypothetical protein IJX55_01980 [Clostridia bacterium]|nr:hypothetical protein [Clostridia bacterium]